MQSSVDDVADKEAPAQDLGPLAWVLDELRKSLEAATKAIRRFVRDAELARGSDLESLDSSQLRIARQQLHQAVGALEMVGLAEPAKLLRAMETLAQKFVERPEFCSDDAVLKVERAGFALVEFLEAVLRGKSATAVSLFPQYRDIQALIGEDRTHPSDLWSHVWHWVDAEVPVQIEPRNYEPAVRQQLDSGVLRVIKTSSVSGSKALRDVCLGLAYAQTQMEPRAFWKICAAFFEAISLKLCPADVYSKRAASRLLMQYTQLAKGQGELSERLVQDILFFCSLAAPTEKQDAPVLKAVRDAYGLTQTRAVSYDVPQYGRFDPAVLVQARKRIATATETWSALSGGDTNRLKVVTDQFAQVGESLLKLHVENKELSRALMKAVDATVKSGEPPSTPVAMEVATAILYLDAAYEDLDPADASRKERSDRLARRLEHVLQGGEPESLEPWMEELYRRVSDRQTMGSVVEELRSGLTEIEKSLDTFFRNPKDKAPLNDVPNQLAQMRGVFSVLGLDQASHATMRMRDTVEKFLVDTIDEGTAASGVFEKFGNSLGALGFLIDMLSYQRALAKKLFVFDEEAGEFKPLMGREAAAAQPAVPQPSRAPAPAPARQAVDTSPTPTRTVALPKAEAEEDDTDLREIFLEEAKEVVQNGQAAIGALVADPSNLADQTTLRRAFHTLKGSSRMVSFNELGEAAWAMEQMMNTWLAEQKPVPTELLQVASSGLQGLGNWVAEIAQGRDAGRSAAPFRASADAMRLEGRYLPLAGEESAPLVPAPAPGDEVSAAATEDSAAGMISFDLEDTPTKQVGDTPAEPLLDSTDLDFGSIDFGVATDEPASSAPSLEPVEVEGIDFSSLGGLTALSSDAPEAPAPTPELDIDWDPTRHSGIDDLSPLSDVPVASLDLSSTAKLKPGELPPFELPELQSNWADTTTPSVESVLPKTSLPEEPLVEGFDFDFSIPEAPATQSPAEEQVKVIGDLRIGIPLYNVFLNEADEWSRRLVTELNEWALELHQPVPDSAIALAHSLGGSSATVGFKALSDIARALEHALQHVKLQGEGQPDQAQVFVASAENIRHLLHQFAAGFLKSPEPELMEALQTISATDFAELSPPDDAPSTTGLEVSEAPDIDFGDLSLDFTEAAPTTTSAPVAPRPQPVTPLPGAAQIVVQDEDDDIDAVNALDPDLLPIFQEEAAELMPQLGASLRLWSEDPDASEPRLDVLRALHTIKGSARLAGAMRMGEMAHRMETAIEQMGTEYVQAAQIEPMLTRYDRLQEEFDTLGQEPDADVGLSVEAESEPVDAPSAPVAAASATPPVIVPTMASPAQPALAAGRAFTPPPMRVTPIAAAARVTHPTVRVRSNLLDRLVNQAGEVMITRSRIDARLNQLTGSLGELSTNLDRLRSHLRDVELQAETQMQSRLAQAKDTAQGFDPLEFDRFTRVQELTRMMAESVNDVATVQRNLQQAITSTEDDLVAQGRQTRELQRDLLRTRMQEFEGISERLYGVVRQASKDAGKQVRLDIRGGAMEVDRGVLDRMAPAFEHILRNSVAHGVENPKTREAAGKAPVGTITISVHQEGNDVSITFSDDGGGLNLPRIREKALAQGLVAPGEALSDADASNLIFMPGFSTASSVTELAGRGIGMDVVRAEVQALGGRIETTTVAGQGTSFKLVLPLTTAVTQVLMLRMGDLSVGMPSNLVEIVRRLSQSELDQAYAEGSIAFGDEQVPMFWGGALLQASARSHEQNNKTLPVVVLRSAGQRVAIHVDEVLGNQEVVVKNLGPQLSRLPGLAGMSVLASGAVVLIYNPVALVAVYGQQALALQRGEPMPEGVAPLAGAGAEGTVPQGPGSGGELPLVLVVDDSITVRRVTQRLLRREGYRVALAADGLQALERLAEEKPDVVLSDIEMPRMDGFDLVRNIRADAKLKDLPVIMITSRIAQKHRDLAEQLGVSNYLGKPYAEDELLALIKHYCSGAVAA